MCSNIYFKGHIRQLHTLAALDDREGEINMENKNNTQEPKLSMAVSNMEYIGKVNKCLE